MSDLVESYENLVTKVHVCLTFYLRHCGSVPFLMKVDDDVSVDLDRLFDTWDKSEMTTEKLFCALLNNREPIRDSSSKWYVPKGKWPPRLYPAYCNGPLYIMGNVAVKRILQQSMRLPLFIMEDVFYTGFVAGSLGIKIVDWKDKIQNHLQYEQVEVPVCGPNSSAITVAHFPLSTPEEMMKGSLKLKRTICFPFPWIKE
ncbi:unnamed protein product [Cylicocyclus nassatus]|uniref:Hexosyltransferase n=1 Tax=Cylicocyclus nassatus TaxID=53992 RepID=A0AA36DLS9_CYLNA|nr:unnamed protein product [Cylicocyclus nassatus]